MRYNPPPNWPKPPKGWAPHADWSPDPSWPPPPQGWRLWVEEDEEGPEPPSALGRLRHAGDDSEYFGDENAWADDSGPAPSDDDRLDRAITELPPHPTEVAPEDLAVQHLGQYATVKWADEKQYAIGTILAVSADAAEVRLKLDGIDGPIAFPRETPGSPKLLVWM
ncbi:hypothetical protein PT015_13120 [Candidatus Mycobacterium wuenschmannii]|uniref:Uncharacterized protein n=1 Tax=Candidatus Mycobacterium wuenschmannii TaxID=3027808 RepID=A0ABY8VQH2_9MYCO|nr:hypothetical protein [Candidatus Mycobacterium wuenschmannii]WIM85888.1 hypothetical protein PT015_13120 [Candidatus Mycobacterium wuenschmannii]